MAIASAKLWLPLVDGRGVSVAVGVAVGVSVPPVGVDVGGSGVSIGGDVGVNVGVNVGVGNVPPEPQLSSRSPDFGSVTKPSPPTNTEPLVEATG